MRRQEDLRTILRQPSGSLSSVRWRSAWVGEWFQRVQGKDGRLRWIKAADLRPVEAWCLAAVSSAESQRCENLMAQAGIDP